MNKNTVLGLLLIAAILFGFSWYNNKQYEKARKEQARKDSIEMAMRPPVPSEQPKPQEQQTIQPSDSPEANAIAQTEDALAKARQGTEEYFTLGNELIEVTFSNKGGRIAAVNLKDYTTYKGKPLMLFETQTNNMDRQTVDGSAFNLTFFAPERINTADYYFEPIPTSPLQMTFRLHADSSSYFDLIYSIRPEEYMVDFRVDFSNFSDKLAANQPDMNLSWSIISPQQEKGFQNENTFTTVAYRYPNETSAEDLGFSTGEQSKEVTTKVNWVGFKQQFFSSIIVSKDNFSRASMRYSTYLPGEENIKNFHTDLTLPYAPSVQGYDLNFFFGPNRYYTLKAYDDMAFQRLVPLGWGIFGWVNRYLVIPVFDFLGEYIANFGIVILLLTIFIKILIAPLTFKSYMSTARMRVLKPEIDKINEKFPKKEDALKKQQATMELYKKAGVSPMGGCLPMLIQLPVLIALFRFFPASIELRGNSFLWADDLSAYDSVLNLPFDIPFYGDHISLFTLLMAISVYVSSKINFNQNPSMSNQQMPGMKFMMLYLMPVMLLLWFNNYASGLTYYYLLSNLITIGQTFAFRAAVNDDKLHAQMKENSAKPVKKSKWQQRLEDMQKRQAAMQQQPKAPVPQTKERKAPKAQPKKKR